MTPVRGEVWLLDLGMAQKVRPALVLSVAFGDIDRALITVVPHTTSLRGSQYEVVVPVPFLKAGAFLVQNIATYPTVRAIRRLGVLKRDQVDLVGAGAPSVAWKPINVTVDSGKLPANRLGDSLPHSALVDKVIIRSRVQWRHFCV